MANDRLIDSMLGKLIVSPRNSPSNLIDQLFPRESTICRPLISRIALMLSSPTYRNHEFYAIPSTLGAGGADLGARPPESSSSLEGWPVWSPTARMRRAPPLLIKFDQSCVRVARARRRTGRPSLPTPGGVRGRTGWSATGPALIPSSFLATHSPSPDSPFHRSPSSPARPGIRALAVFRL